MRVFMWNIKQFTLKRIDDSSGENRAEQLRNQEISHMHRALILDTVEEAKPDVFVVLEVTASAGAPNKLVSVGEGPQGLVHLLRQLRKLKNDDGTDQDDWYLVPPLRLNPRKVMGHTYTETVGVFWRDSRMSFRGPLFWPKANGEPSPTGPPVGENDPNRADSYPDPWDDVMPAGADANRAGWAAPIPEAPDVLGNDDAPSIRRPYVTDFKEKTGDRRDIRLLSMHLPPNSTAAETLRKLLYGSASVIPPPNGLVLIAGDMNIDLTAPSLAQEAYVQSLTNASFEELLPYPLRAQSDFDTWKTNAPSMLRKAKQAELNNYWVKKLYDYGFVRYGTPPAPGKTYKAVIADRVYGVGRRIGLEEPIQTFKTHMLLTPEELSTTRPASAITDVFQEPSNYGHIRGTSDHMAVLREV
jgi:hypothetical protein